MASIEEFLDWIRPAGPIAGILTSFIGVGALIDQYIRDSAREEFGRYLSSGRLADQIIWLPDGTNQLFEHVFGPKHWTLNCFWRSVTFSIVTILALSILRAIHSEDLRSDVATANFAYLTLLAMWVLVACLVDYISLFKTRLILRWITKRNAKRTWVGLIAAAGDFATYYVTYAALAAILVSLIDGLFSWIDNGHVFDLHIARQFWLNLSRLAKGLTRSWEFYESAFGVLFLAGLVPSIWLWACALAVSVMRVINRAMPTLRLAKRILPLESHPARSVGIVAGLLCSAAYVAMMLASDWIR